MCHVVRYCFISITLHLLLGSFAKNEGKQFTNAIIMIYHSLLRSHSNIYQKGVYYSGTKIFSSLPRDIKTCIDNPRTFKKTEKNVYTQIPSTH
jgi:hypothetical protein